MAKKKITRKELLKSPDEFMTLSSRAAVFLAEHTRQLKIAGIGALVVVALYLAGYGYFRSVNKGGQEAYNRASDALVTEMKNPDAKAKDLAEPEKLFEEVVQGYGMSKAARLALPQLGRIKFEEKKYDEAIGIYADFLEKVKNDMEYESLTRLALASCYEAKGSFTEAIAMLSPIVDSPKNPFREKALLGLETAYRLNNQPDKAKEILKTFVEEYPNSPFFPMAHARS